MSVRYPSQRRHGYGDVRCQRSPGAEEDARDVQPWADRPKRPSGNPDVLDDVARRGEERRRTGKTVSSDRRPRAQAERALVRGDLNGTVACAGGKRELQGVVVRQIEVALDAQQS